MATAKPWESDGLFVGPALVARLREQVPALREVLLFDEIDPKAGAPRQTPSAVVLLDALLPAPTPTNAVRSSVELTQRWMVLLAVRTASGRPDRVATEVGPLIPAVVKAVQGWFPPGHSRALSWVAGGRPDYGRDISYFPLLFQVQIVT